MTGEGWEMVLRAGLERFALAAPEVSGEIAVVGDGRLWAVLWLGEDGEVEEILTPTSPQKAAYLLWDVWSRAKGLREAAVTN